MTNKYFYAELITEPEDVIQHLAKQERHWKKGYPAYELTLSWVRAKGIPEPIAAVLHQAEEFWGAELIEGFSRMVHSVRAIPAVLCRRAKQRGLRGESCNARVHCPSPENKPQPGAPHQSSSRTRVPHRADSGVGHR